MDAQDYTCKCNNCNAVLIDENPQTRAKKNELTGNERTMVMAEDERGEHWACPNCLTDYYLMDT